MVAMMVIRVGIRRYIVPEAVRLGRSEAKDGCGQKVNLARLARLALTSAPSA